jgi:hypothetical protein
MQHKPRRRYEDLPPETQRVSDEIDKLFIKVWRRVHATTADASESESEPTELAS